MSETSISQPTPKDILRYYLNKLEYLKNSGADFDETNSVSVQLRDYLETLDLSAETTKIIDYGLGRLFEYKILQIDILDSDLSPTQKQINDGLNPIMKSLSILIEQPRDLRPKKSRNNVGMNLMKSNPSAKHNVGLIVEFTNLIVRLADFIHNWITK